MPTSTTRPSAWPSSYRLLEAQGFRVGIIAQPDWQSKDDFMKLGEPNLFFGVAVRQHGLDDQPLHRGQEGPFRRRLHPRRPGRQAPGPRQPGLQPALQGGLQPCAGDPRRDRGLVAPYRPLRLLAGQGPPLDPDGRHGRHPALRQRRACGGGNRPAPGPGRTAERDHRRARHRLRPSRHPGGLVRDRFHADRPVRARSTRSSIPT